MLSKPIISWEAIVSETTQHTTQYQYICKLTKVNANDPGYGELVVGYYIVDFIGHIFRIEEINYGGDATKVRVEDLLQEDYSYGPYNDRNAYVYDSLTKAALLSQAKLNRLDQSAEDFVRSLHLDPKYLEVDYIDFNTSYTGDLIQGRLQWNADEDTLDIGQQNDVVQQIGAELSPMYKNQTGSTIYNGTPVMAAGAVGASGKVLIMPAIADGTYLPAYTLGVTTEDIANGDDGHVTWFGKVRGIDTTGTPYGEVWAEGDPIYVSATTAGYLTNIPPDAPNYRISIGIVINVHATNGTISVRPVWRSKITDLADVDGTPLDTDGQILVWDDTNQYFDPTHNINDYLRLDQTTPQTIENGIPLMTTNVSAGGSDYQIVNKKYVDDNKLNSPLTTKGDIWTYSSVDARLPVGTNGQILSADSTETTGLKWIDAPSEGVTPVSDILYWDSGNSKYTPYSSRTSGCLYSGTDTPTGTTRLNYDGHLYLTRLNASASSGNIISITGSDTSSYALYTSGGIETKINSSASTKSSLYVHYYYNVTSPGTVSQSLLKLERDVLGTGNLTGDIISIIDNPSNSGIISGKILTATIESTERISLNPRVVDGVSAISYLLDTHTNLATSGAKVLSVKNSGTEKFYVGKDDIGIVNKLYLGTTTAPATDTGTLNALVWDNTTGEVKQRAISGGSSITIGNTGQIPYSNTGTPGTNFNYSANFSWSGRTFTIDDGSDNIYIGALVGTTTTSGSNNVAIGDSSGTGLTSGTFNVFIGADTGWGLSTNSYNVYVGGQAGHNSIGAGNTMIGAFAGKVSSGTRDIDGSVFIGRNAGYYETASNKLFIDNQSRTNEATSRTSSLIYGEFNSTVKDQFIRFNGRIENYDGYSNTRIGYLSGYSLTDGTRNTILGYESGYSITGGDYNVLIGRRSGYAITTGNSNVLIGEETGKTLSSGSFNTFIGRQAGALCTGTGNTLIGNSTGLNISSGEGNTLIGRQSGISLTTGTYNVFIGYNAGSNETGSNTLYIDNKNYASESLARVGTLIYGIFDSTVSNQLLRVNGIFQIPDGLTAPSTVSGYAQIYVDSADGDLKVKFGDGKVKTIVTDS